jgi:murein DD-endopeptidase MepM/ murein hydrolase activator NlpD
MKRSALIAVATLLLGTSAAVAPSAQAMPYPPPPAPVGQNGVCETGEFCLYYNSNNAGSMVDLSGGRKNYGADPATCIKFITSGSGRGLCVKNNAASVWNREAAVVTVFYKSNWAGAIDSIGSGAKVNLSATLKNEDAGHVVGSAANDSLQFGLYHASGAHISAYFDGYLNTPGRHEGTDIARNIGDPVYALTSGRVTRVAEGHTGGDGLSTIAIYNADLNKTVVYLHTNPLDSLDAGDTVSRGQKIATQSWRGISSSSASHTHVEMRLGEQRYAAPSVGDPDLTNPIPTEFWMNRGYNICCS